MSKGTQAKQRIFTKLLEVFPGSFMQDDKILRIVEQENGEIVEIKVTLTAAKDILGAGTCSNQVTKPTTTEEFDWSDTQGSSGIEAAAAADLNETEKENIRRMMKALGLKG